MTQPRIELGFQDSKSCVITFTLLSPYLILLDAGKDSGLTFKHSSHLKIATTFFKSSRLPESNQRLEENYYRATYAATILRSTGLS